MSSYHSLYYDCAEKASRNIEGHPGLVTLRKTASTCRNILECGCGEGSKLEQIGGDCRFSIGIDINQHALARANARSKGNFFCAASLAALPFSDNSFDMVYSAFALEHLTDPLQGIEEMIRVTAPRGFLGFLCPNYGSLCFRSPCSREPVLKRTLRILLRDLT